jgi:hypothetical protein
MSIKNVRPSKKSPYIQSYYKPINTLKYIGSGPIICRSSWEKKVCIYLDNNVDVIHWASENFGIKYYDLVAKKVRTYYPDFYFKAKRGDKIIEYVVEVKPSAQLKKPKKPKINQKKAILNYKRMQKTFITNMCKIDALKKFAKERKFEVLIITEKTWFI